MQNGKYGRECARPVTSIIQSMKHLLVIIVALAFAVSASAHCGKCEGDKKADHKCTEACKAGCKGKEHKCTDACKDGCPNKADPKK